MDNRVFVISSTGVALMPCHPARARMLLKTDKAYCEKVYPFTIKLTEPPMGMFNGTGSNLNKCRIIQKNDGYSYKHLHDS